MVQHTIEKIKEKFPLEKCRAILEKNGKKFSVDQILMIRDFLFQIARASYNAYVKEVQKEFDHKYQEPAEKTIPKNKNEKESSSEFKQAA
jgi:hypothetical protein